jgi:membrane fusion protein (multidrug efflux system)
MARKSRVAEFCFASLLAIFVVTLLLSGCRRAQNTETPPPPTVEVVEVVKKDVPLYSEWTASTDGLVNATIRAQVQGLLIKRHYTEGDFVKQGQVLFEIDPRTFQAALQQARAQLAEQQARWETVKANLERIKPLVEQRAVSRKDFDDAVGAEAGTRAAVTAAQAMVDKVQLDLGFTKVISPIDGIAGIAKAQLGNLVGPGSLEELTMVSTVDPIKVYILMSEQEYLKNVQNGRGHGQQMPLELILADGKVHPHAGFFAFADRQVDVKTGTIKVAALFPNPGNVIRPGQFARVRAQTSIKKDALLVPQRAIMELQAGYQVAVVGSDGKVMMRPVKVAERVDGLWAVHEGVKPGEQVIAEGLQKVKQGMVVTTKPFIPIAGNGSDVRSKAAPEAAAKPGSLPAPDKTGKR